MHRVAPVVARDRRGSAPSATWWDIPGVSVNT
jgi:hypothetical protein